MMPNSKRCARDGSKVYRCGGRASCGDKCPSSRASRTPMRQAGTHAFLALLCATLTACAVGPDFKAPEGLGKDPPAHWRDPQRAPDASASGQAPKPGAGAAKVPDATSVSSKPTEDSDPDPLWWRSFNDPTLDRLIERAAQSNLDLREAVLRIVEARAQAQGAAAQGLPNVRATGSYTREQLGIKGFVDDANVNSRIDQLGAPGSPVNQIAPGAGATVQSGARNLVNRLEQPVNLWQAGFDASWELDLFGRVRRSVEAANAQTEAAVESRNDALLSLEGEVAQTYVQLRGAQAQLDIAKRLVDEQDGVLKLTQSQAKVGLASQQDVQSAAAQLESTRAQLPQFEQQIVQALNGLSYLLAEPPGALDDELSTPSAVPPVPPVVATGVPSTLARRRPDIRRAEADLHAATANVGVAVAQFYPDISLTGQIGLRGTHASDLARWSHLFYSFGPSISLPVFQGGALVSNLHVTQAQQAQAALEYRKTVLLALRDVDNALAVYRTDQARRTSLERSASAQQDAFDLARESYRKGLTNFINVLDAERQLSQVRQQYAQSTTQVSTDLVALYKALGGGWTQTSGTQSGSLQDAPAAAPATAGGMHPASQALNAPAGG
ncbi:NodT family efflux transporter outer membrane factor (OMF) lipoprotein [Paraburkholderia rhizosphaerae]|uniref:NodT family efflux transporter outer membrane factor (OMF) lipoprotein n=2 Tax=Paraburkholderia rhizosphaerae TaxID=480658 RepID=A0A4R8L9I5_9BURK|nr:NodT family efflux transporter outer membrane factor (OMF) lipoprotein [Paraburkholderia rhizosphaerae]